MKYAIIVSGGKQYKAVEGGVLDVDKIDIEAGKTHKFEKVLLFSDDGICQIGKPLLSDISVSAKVIEQFKGDKIRVAKFKAKSRYRRVQGHRQLLTKIQIEKISTNQPATENQEKAKPKKEVVAKKAKTA
ncbi:50S ribosomal protein L21 [Patescibacteria group bacterium]|nr:50S ribosomal protein L21 [Patescibacteria group bacterium]